MLQFCSGIRFGVLKILAGNILANGLPFAKIFPCTVDVKSPNCLSFTTVSKLLYVYVNDGLMNFLLTVRRIFIKSRRIVMDLRNCYYLDTEELGCDECGESFQSWKQW